MASILSLMIVSRFHSALLLWIKCVCDEKRFFLPSERGWVTDGEAHTVLVFEFEIQITHIKINIE